MKEKEREILNELKKCKMFVTSFTDEKVVAWASELLRQGVNGKEFKYAIDKFKKNPKYGNYGDLWFYIEEFRELMHSSEKIDAFEHLLYATKRFGLGNGSMNERSRIEYLNKNLGKDGEKMFRKYYREINNTAGDFKIKERSNLIKKVNDEYNQNVKSQEFKKEQLKIGSGK